MGLLELSELQQVAADVTGDGTVTALDSALILQYTTGLITQFPVEVPTAPVLTAQSGKDALIKAIAQLEATAINREQKQVLEQLKSLVFKKSPPKRAVLLQNFPNPFNPETWLPYNLAEAADVTIQIYDVRGHLIRTLYLGQQPAGFYLSKNKAAYWDGRNTSGERVSSGLYFYRLSAGDFSAMRRMVIAK